MALTFHQENQRLRTSANWNKAIKACRAKHTWPDGRSMIGRRILNGGKHVQLCAPNVEDGLIIDLWPTTGRFRIPNTMEHRTFKNDKALVIAIIEEALRLHPATMKIVQERAQKSLPPLTMKLG